MWGREGRKVCGWRREERCLGGEDEEGVVGGEKGVWGEGEGLWG